MEGVDVPKLVERLGSDEDAVRKMAAFKLQSSIGDPSFADVFISEGGLPRLRYLILHATGNTLAYSLTCFSRLLEVDKGWNHVNQDVVERVGTASKRSMPCYPLTRESRLSSWSSRILWSIFSEVQWPF